MRPFRTSVQPLRVGPDGAFASVLVLAVLMVLGGCRDFAVDGKSNISASPLRSIDVEISVPFQMGVGDEAYLTSAGLTATLAMVLEDTRCLREGSCTAPGQAGLLLEISRDNGDQSQIILQIPGLVPLPYRANAAVTHGGLMFRLLALEPYPDGLTVPGGPAAEPYEATLLIEGVTP